MTFGDARNQLLQALRRALRPVVRLLIRTGIGFDEFAEVARGVYVECAIRDRPGLRGTPTREQVALIIGVPRPHVDYYIDNEDALPAADSPLENVAVEVLHKWFTDPQYLGPYGLPLELELDLESSRSFRGLVASVDRHASAALVLEQLVRAGSVTCSEERRLSPLTRSFILREATSPHRIEFFGTTFARLAETLEYNFDPANSERKRLERFVATDRGLPRKLLPEFEAYARDRTDQFLAELDDWLGRNADAQSGDGDARVATGVNVFLYVDSPSKERPVATLVQQISSSADR